MALITRCSCCGYKFKRGDGAICPECFTSREETIGCDDISSDLHSHSKGFASTDNEMTEVEKQLEQERMQAAQQKAAMNADSASTMGGTATGNRSTNFGGSSSNKSSTAFGGSTSQNRSSTLGSEASNSRSTTFTTKNGRTTTTTYTSSDGSKTTTYSTSYSTSGVGPMSTYRTYNSTSTKSNGSRKATKIIVIVFIVMFLISFVAPIIVGIIGFNVAKDAESKADNNYNAVTFDIPEVSVPDIEIPEIPEVDVPDIPVLTPPEVPEIPYFPQFGSGTNYYTDIAIIAQGEKIVTDQYEIEIGKPSYVAIEPVSFATDYADYIDWETPGDCITVEVPLTITNNSGERLEIVNFEAYFDCLFISEEGEIEDERFAYPLPTDVYLNSVIEDGVTYSFSLHYAVPVAPYYSVALELEYLDNPDYMFYVDYTAEQVIK